MCEIKHKKFSHCSDLSSRLCWLNTHWHELLHFNRRFFWLWENDWIKTMSRLHDVDQHTHDRWHLRLPRQLNPNPPPSYPHCRGGGGGWGGMIIQHRAPCAVSLSNWSPGSGGPEAHQMGTHLLETYKCFIILSDYSRFLFQVDVHVVFEDFYTVQ